LLLLCDRLLLLSLLRGEPLGVAAAVAILSMFWLSDSSRRLVCGVRPGPGDEPLRRLAGDGDAA
jgi:hypothetical protein